MGNNQIKKHQLFRPVNETKKSFTMITNLPKENLIWLDSNINSKENLFYQSIIDDTNKFKLSSFTNIQESMDKLKSIKFEKTYIVVSGSLSKEFFFEFEKIINEVKICPIIIIFTSKKKLNLIKKNILDLEKFSFFDMNLVFDDFSFFNNVLLFEDIYKPINVPIITSKNYDNCFTFEYINGLNDLILPLTFKEFMEIPSKSDILEFNEFLLDKYQKSSMQFKELISQLLVDTNIPIPILVKYWIRAYTIQSNFYGDINYTLIKKLNNDFDIYIRVLYQGLKIKAIKPLIDANLYRGSIIKLKEINYIKESLSKKKENIPGCICYNKSILSTSLDETIAKKFLNKIEPKQDEIKALFVIKKRNELDTDELDDVSNMDIQEYSIYNEKEIIFLPFSCFEITEIIEKNDDGNEFLLINLNYIGKYKNKINREEKIPDNNFAKDMVSSDILDKIEMNKTSNKNKFDFDIEKYIEPKIKQSYIKAIYEITKDDINKNIQILNCDEQINKNELEKICNIYLNKQKIPFTFESNFFEPGEYVFTFEFNELLINANKLFYGCSNIKSLNFSKFKSSYIKDMTDMFNGCSKLESLDLSNFRTKKVITMKGLFKKCTALKILDLSSFNTSHVIDMSEMFSECISLTFLNLGNFETEKVKTMYRMFYKCTSLYAINLSKAQSKSINNTSEMFSDCTSLNSLNLSLFEIGDNIHTEKMFYNCLYFKSIINEFISGLNDIYIENLMKKTCEKFFLNESQIISNEVQSKIKSKNNRNVQLINQEIEYFIKKIKHINILILGEKKKGLTCAKALTIKAKNGDLNSILDENDYNSYEAGYLRFYQDKINITFPNIDYIVKTIEETINDINSKGLDSTIHYIWYCFSGTNIDNLDYNILNKLMDKYQNKIEFFINYLNCGENSVKDFNNFKKDLAKKISNKKYEIFHISSENIYESEKLDEIINKLMKNFNNIIFKNIVTNFNLFENVKQNLENITILKNLKDIPTTLSKHFEIILGHKNDIVDYIYKRLEDILNNYKTSIDKDVWNNIIENFKKEKLKLKISESKKKEFDIDKINNELIQEINKKYEHIFQNFYQDKFKEEMFSFFDNFLKKESLKIIDENRKEFKIKDLEPFIKNNLHLETN